MEEKSISTTVDLTKWQQKMLKDMFGVTTATLDIFGDVRDWVKYKTPHVEAMAKPYAQRMYLEDGQKEQIAKIMGTRAEIMCDYIELDPEVILKYAALHRSNLLYGSLRKSD